MFITFKIGMLLGLSIIISIGAQNLFVIQQALRNEYTYSSALICFLCDFILIVSGVAGLSAFLIKFPGLKLAILIFGILFLSWYGFKSLRRSFSIKSAEIIQQTVNHASMTSLSKIILLGLSFSLLNPAAILDTIVIIGGSATQYIEMEKYFFIAGTIFASFIWFFGLAGISRYFSTKIMTGSIWRIMDFISGILMLSIAIGFLRQI